MSDAVTQPFAPQPQPQPEPGKPKRRGPMIAILVVVALLLVAALVTVLAFSLGGLKLAGAASPSPTASTQPAIPSTSPTPIAITQPSPTPSSAGTGTGSGTGSSGTSGGSTGGSGTSGTSGGSGSSGSGAAALTLTAHADTTTVTCNKSAPAGQPPLYVTFTWKATGVSQVYFGVDTADAQAGPLYTNLPPQGSSASDFSNGPISYACYEPKHTYTFTVVDAAGHKLSRTITVVNNGDTD